MFPWEHLGFGYLCYSLLAHLFGRRPTAWSAVAVGFATQFPDLVDKTLSWVLGVFPQGYSVAHSAFTATLLSLVAVALAARRGRPFVGLAFAVGYLSHLVGDVAYPALYGDGLAFEAILWPLVDLSAYEVERGALERALYYVEEYVERLIELEPGPFLVFQLLFVGSVFVLWLYDGAPVATELWRYLSADRSGR